MKINDNTFTQVISVLGVVVAAGRLFFELESYFSNK